MAVSTASFLSGLTTAVPLRMRETVAGETPASLATISKVTVPEGCAVASFFVRLITEVLIGAHNKSRL
jgi:hypothetical protein